MSQPSVLIPGNKKSQSAVAAKSILKSNLTFKMAKLPEAVSVKPASYIQIKPNPKVLQKLAPKINGGTNQKGANSHKSNSNADSDSELSSSSDEESEAEGYANEREEEMNTDSSTSSSDDEEDTIKFEEDDDLNSDSEEEDEENEAPAEKKTFAFDSISKAQKSNFDAKQEEEDDEDSNQEEEESEEEVPEQKIHTTTTYKLLELHQDSKDRGNRPESQIIKAWPTGARNPRGLLNSGVTCYMNSAIQLFFHIPPFVHFMQDVFKNKVKEVSKTSVTKDLASLHHKVNDPSITRNIYPAAIIKRLDDINPMMSMWQQEDAHEYFMSLLSRVQEDTVPPGKKLRTSIIHEIFGGTYEQKVTCQTCHSVSTTHQDFYDLPVSFSAKEKKQKGRFTLQGAVREFFSPVVIKHERNNGYDCEKCKKMTTGVAVSKIEDPSEYLVVNIKRFNFKEKSSRKIKDPIQYPMDLDLTEYSLTPEVPLKYKLIGVTLHEGRTTSSGHYVAFCNQPNKTWALYDDESVRKTNEKAVLKHQEAAYFLLYARLTPVAETTTTTTTTAKPTKTPKVKVEKSTEKVTNGGGPGAGDSVDDAPDNSHPRKRKRSLMPELSTTANGHKTSEEPPSPKKSSTMTSKHRSKSMPANLSKKPVLSSSSSLSSLHVHHGHSSSKFKGSSSSPHTSFANLSKKLARKREERKRTKRRNSNGEISLAEKLLAKSKKKKSKSSATLTTNGSTTNTTITKGANVLDASIKKRKLDSEIDKIFGK
jgi:ubiquitin carboxyl-terminal hydrolase 10